jgi:hypothetical protein
MPGIRNVGEMSTATHFHKDIHEYFGELGEPLLPALGTMHPGPIVPSDPLSSLGRNR